MKQKQKNKEIDIIQEWELLCKSAGWEAIVNKYSDYTYLSIKGLYGYMSKTNYIVVSRLKDDLSNLDSLVKLNLGSNKEDDLFIGFYVHIRDSFGNMPLIWENPFINPYEEE